MIKSDELLESYWHFLFFPVDAFCLNVTLMFESLGASQPLDDDFFFLASVFCAIRIITHKSTQLLFLSERESSSDEYLIASRNF